MSGVIEIAKKTYGCQLEARWHDNYLVTVLCQHVLADTYDNFWVTVSCQHVLADTYDNF